jgi:protein-arginine kinase activator protein McsA
MSSTLCDLCREKPASVFVTKIVNNETTKHRLCADCARLSAGSPLSTGAESSPDDTADAADLPLEEIMKNLFAQSDVSALWKQTNGEDESDVDENEAEVNTDSPIDVFWSMSLGHVPSEKFSAEEFPGDEDMVDEMDEAESDESDRDQTESEIPFQATTPNLLEQSSTQIFGEAAHNVTGAGEVASVRCPKCGTTWDRLKQDGRAGCAQCYSAFSAQLSRVMMRVQRSSQHAGKAPRTAEKTTAPFDAFARAPRSSARNAQPTAGAKRRAGKLRRSRQATRQNQNPHFDNCR